MEVIEGVDLAQEAKLATDTYMEEQRSKVRRVVSGVVADIAAWKRDVVTKEKELAGLRDKVRGAEEKYRKLVNGDWSVLNENMFKDKPTSEKATA